MPDRGSNGACCWSCRQSWTCCRTCTDRHLLSKVVLRRPQTMLGCCKKVLQELYIVNQPYEEPAHGRDLVIGQCLYAMPIPEFTGKHSPHLLCLPNKDGVCVAGSGLRPDVPGRSSSTLSWPSLLGDGVSQAGSSPRAFLGRLRSVEPLSAWPTSKAVQLKLQQ